MELTRSQSNKLGRFCAAVCSRFGQAKPWLTPRKIKAAIIERDSNLLAHVLEDGVGAMFDDDLRQSLVEVIGQIPERRGNGVAERKREASEARRQALLSDLEKHGPALSEHGRLALVYALLAGLKGEDRKAQGQELCGKYGCTIP